MVCECIALDKEPMGFSVLASDLIPSPHLTSPSPTLLSALRSPLVLGEEPDLSTNSSPCPPTTHKCTHLPLHSLSVVSLMLSHKSPCSGPQGNTWIWKRLPKKRMTHTPFPPISPPHSFIYIWIPGIEAAGTPILRPATLHSLCSQLHKGIFF